MCFPTGILAARALTVYLCPFYVMPPSRIDEIIANIPGMRGKERAEWRDKVHRVLARRPDDPDALRLNEALEGAAARPDSARLIKTGHLAWEPHSSEQPNCRGFADGVAVARIFKRVTHTATRKEVYSVELDGRILSGRHHRIEEARQAGEMAFRISRGVG
jgi:hypothetical protein